MIKRKTKKNLHSAPLPSDRQDSIILVGNPNVGKSVIFSELTGKYAVVSNYPGTTVELCSGSVSIENEDFKVLDTPGINSLFPKSEDELVTLRILLENPNATILQVLNSVNIKRGLFVTSQLALIGVKTVLALNISDEADSKGISIDEKRLSRLTGIETIKTVATRKEGIFKLKKSLLKPAKITSQPRFDPPIEEAIQEIASMLPQGTANGRFLALLFLCDGDNEKILNEALTGSSLNLDKIKMKADKMRAGLSKTYNGTLSFQINRQIHREAERLYDEVVLLHIPSESRLASRAGRMMMHPLWGFLFVILVLLGIYWVVGRLGAGTIVEFIEEDVFGKILTPALSYLVDKTIPSGLFRDFLIGKYGLWTIGITYAIAIVLPIVFLFFFIFGILEDSGYLPRLAVMLNKPFRFMGLSGKAVLPMVLGLGCAAMATLTARILETKKEKILVTLLLALGVPCSAQLGVIIGMLGILPGGALLWWLGSIIFVLLAVGKIASYVVPGENTQFIQEIPPLRLPQLKNLMIKTFARIRWYLKEAVPLFLFGALILFVLNETGLIVTIERISAPILSGLMGLPKETTSAFILGFIRRDYAATGLFDLFRSGGLTAIQGLVGMVAITLFIPCVANLFVIIKERGLKTAVWMSLFIIPFSILFASLLNVVLKLLGVTFT